jgi:hypothetical protein
VLVGQVLATGKHLKIARRMDTYYFEYYFCCPIKRCAVLDKLK